LYNKDKMRHTFEAIQWLPYPVELVFAFFANPENLPRLMPKWQKARIEEAAFAPPPPRPTSANPIRLRGIIAGAGTRMTLSFRPFPLSPFRVPWDAEITEFLWNDHFCDIQHRGPFAYWSHCHRLQPETRIRDGAALAGTLLRDEVKYELPLGAVGQLAQRFFMERQVKSIFNFRHQRTAELLPLFAAASK
jgi:ligand-binding SRPBCC domain-containing protein